MSGVSTFWCEPTGHWWRWLRRYHSKPSGTDWTCAGGWHEAKVRIDDVDGEVTSGDLWPHDDPRWPTECAAGCGYRFTDDDEWQLSAWSEYRRADTGETLSLHDAPVGAMWDASWMGDHFRGPDGISLVVKCPQNDGTRGLDWMVDSRASNCTLPDDNVHRCWVRHGDPRSERVTVDKNGVTCAAGAGSIQIGDWHGFLRNGELVA